MTILAITGLERERRLVAAAAGVDVIAGGGDYARLEAELEQAAAGRRGVISIGIAGGLAAGLLPGMWILADAVWDDDKLLSTDPAWMNRLAMRLPEAVKGSLVGANDMVVQASQKAELHRTTGAVAVDMESHIVARVASRRGLPFAVARVICDPAQRSLPPAARVGMRPDGRLNVSAVLRSLASGPWQLPALVRTGLEAERAFRALVGGCRRLGPGLGSANLGQPSLDVT